MKDGVHPQYQYNESATLKGSEYEKWFKEQWESAIGELKGFDLSQIYLVPNYSRKYP